MRSTSIFERRSACDKPRYFAQAPGLQKHPVYTRTEERREKDKVNCKSCESFDLGQYMHRGFVEKQNCNVLGRANMSGLYIKRALKRFPSSWKSGYITYMSIQNFFKKYSWNTYFASRKYGLNTLTRSWIPAKDANFSTSRYPYHVPSDLFRLNETIGPTLPGNIWKHLN